MLSGVVSIPRVMTPCGLQVQRQLLMHGLSWHSLQGGRFTFAPVPDERTLEAFGGTLGWLDLTRVRAAYAQAGHLTAFHALLADVASAAFPTHHLLIPSQAEALIRRLEHEAWEPDDEDDGEDWRSPPLDGPDQTPAPARLPPHLQAHHDAVRSAAAVAHRTSLVFDGQEARHHTLVLTRAEDRDPLTRLKDWLEFDEDTATFTIDARDLLDLQRVMRAGRALWAAWLDVGGPRC